MISAGPRGQSKLTTGSPLLIASTIDHAKALEARAEREQRPFVSCLAHLLGGAHQRRRSSPRPRSRISRLRARARSGPAAEDPQPPLRVLGENGPQRADQQVEALLRRSAARPRRAPGVRAPRAAAHSRQRVGDATAALARRAAPVVGAVLAGEHHQRAELAVVPARVGASGGRCDSKFMFSIRYRSPRRGGASRAAARLNACRVPSARPPPGAQPPDSAARRSPG